MGSSDLIVESASANYDCIAEPLIVDLDGTLILTDLLHESLVLLVKKAPHLLFYLPIWLISGKAYLKQKLFNMVDIDVASLPFNAKFIDWLREQRLKGRRIILCTASNIGLAEAVANHLQLFDEVLASDEKNNLAGANKAALLVGRFGARGFDYAANSSADLLVWQYARHAIIVEGSSSLIGKATNIAKVQAIFPKKRIDIMVWLKALRVHQWLKNILIFVPILASHQSTSALDLLNLMLAFFSFGLCASSVYISNDLFDLASDRMHPRKKFRPFSSGQISISLGVLISPLLMIFGLLIALHVNTIFLLWMIVYCLLTYAYSWYLKQLVLVDCLTLAFLYTLRIVAGAAAVFIPLSFWLLVFSIFIFLSLAFLKRFIELQNYADQMGGKLSGRGYHAVDATLVQQLGVSSGYVSVLISALYINGENISILYKSPEVMWASVPLILFWISWMWLKASRGLMHDDPIISAIKDRVSILIGILFFTTFLVAQFI